MMVRAAIPAEEYWSRRNDLDRAVIDLQDAERDLLVAIEQRDRWRWRSDHPSDEWEDAGLEYVKAFSLAGSAESRRNAIRERLDSMRWQVDRLEPKAEAEQPEESQEEPKIVLESSPPTPIIERIRYDLRRRKDEPRRKAPELPVFCQAEGCGMRTAKGRFCMEHMPRKTQTPRLKRREDGLCARGCGRPARERRAVCPPCTEAGRLVGSCPTCGKPARGKGGVYCGRHERAA